MFIARRIIQKQNQNISILHKTNSLNECEKPFVKSCLRNTIFDNPLNECEKPIETSSNKKYFANSLNECEKPFALFKI